MLLGDGLKRLCRKGQVHGVARLVRKIDRKARKDGIHRLDPAESPAPVHAEPAGRELDQGLNVVAVQFPGRRHFFEFFSHKVSSGSLFPTRECEYLRT